VSLWRSRSSGAHSRHGSYFSHPRPRHPKAHFFLASRNSGDVAKVNRTTSSPLTVLMSWCRLNTLTPATSCTMASKTGRAVSISWVRTCLSRSQQVPPLVRGERLDQLLFGRGQDALEADDEQITDQVGVDVLGAAAHVFLFKARDPFADGRFDFALCFHGDLAGARHSRSLSRIGESLLAATEQEPQRSRAVSEL
jgi:hypothetical protein